MNFKELGPFVGMTYRGRQMFDTIVKETAEKREKLLSASTSREGDTGDGLLRVHVGDAGYAAEWREYTSGQWAKQLACLFGAIGIAGFVVVMSYGLVTETLGAKLDFLGWRIYIIAPMFSLMFLFMLFIAGGLTYELVSSLKNGFFPSSGRDLFRQLAAQSWLVGDTAIYVSDRENKTSTKVRTVFFDAVGSVYADDEKGNEAIVLSARDGSEIARLPHPVSDAGEADAIATQIIAKMRAPRPEAVTK